MDRHFRIETLTEGLMRARLHDVLALEELFYRQLGLSYSHEVWTEKHFLCSLPGKWQLSQAAFDENNNLIGFMIYSYQDHEKEELRGHRGGVHPEWRNAGVMRAILAAVCADAKPLGFTYISGTTNAANRVSLPAWMVLGYRILSDTELEAFKVRRGRNHDRIEGNRLISPEGHAYYALRRDIE